MQVSVCLVVASETQVITLAAALSRRGFDRPREQQATTTTTTQTRNLHPSRTTYSVARQDRWIDRDLRQNPRNDTTRLAFHGAGLLGGGTGAQELSKRNEHSGRPSLLLSAARAVFAAGWRCDPMCRCTGAVIQRRAQARNNKTLKAHPEICPARLDGLLVANCWRL